MRFVDGLVGLDDQRRRRGRDDQVAILERPALIPDRLVEPGARVDRHDGRGASLDERRVHAMAVQVERDVVGAAAGAEDERVLPLPGRAAVEAFGMDDLPLEIAKARQVRDHGIAADAVGEDEMPGPDDALAAVGAPQPGGPAFRRVVPGAADEFRVRPAVDLHGVGVELEPVSQHVLRDVFRPGRRKFHVGQMVQVDRVVQRQRVVALPPAVADARPLLDDKGIDAQLVQPRRDRETRLGGADHQHRRLPVVIGAGLAAHVRPVVAAEIPRIGSAGRPVGADLLLVALQRLERRRDEPCLHRAAAFGRRRQADEAGATTIRRGELEDRLDAVDAQALHLAGRLPAVRQVKALRGRARLFRCEARGDAVPAGDGGQVPSEGQDVPPMGVRMEQSADPRWRRGMRAPPRRRRASPRRSAGPAPRAGTPAGIDRNRPSSPRPEALFSKPPHHGLIIKSSDLRPCAHPWEQGTGPPTGLGGGVLAWPMSARRSDAPPASRACAGAFDLHRRRAMLPSWGERRMREKRFEVVVAGCGVAGLSAAVARPRPVRAVAVLERAHARGARRAEPLHRGLSADEERDRGHRRFREPPCRKQQRVPRPRPDRRERPPAGTARRLRRGPLDGRAGFIATFADQAGPTIAWLKSFGLRFDFLPTQFLTKSQPRLLPVGGGLALVEALAARAETLGVEFLYETTAERLEQDEDGRVTGLRARSGQAGRLRLGGEVVLACGGFEGNAEMLARYIGPRAAYLRPICKGGYYNRGEGIRHGARMPARRPAGDFGSYHAEPVDPRSGIVRAVGLHLSLRHPGQQGRQALHRRGAGHGRRVLRARHAADLRAARRHRLRGAGCASTSASRTTAWASAPTSRRSIADSLDANWRRELGVPAAALEATVRELQRGLRAGRLAPAGAGRAGDHAAWTRPNRTGRCRSTSRRFMPTRSSRPMCSPSAG